MRSLVADNAPPVVDRAITSRRTSAEGVGSSGAPSSRSAEWRVTLAPLVLLPILAMLVIGRVPAWAFMWAMAGALYAGCKWLTYRRADERRQAGVARAIAYLVAWPGMDAKAFLVDTPGVQPGRRGEWLLAAAKTAMGVILIRGVAPAVLPTHALLAGWIAMSGVMFLLHFGTFHLLSLTWRQTGIDARPIMRHPLRSVSLAEFWGRRWNIAFHELATRFTFAPLRRVLGVPVATVAVFVVSGLVHELVITLPARGGYGLPTIYFLLQGVGLVTERSRIGRRLGFGRGVRGRLFAVLTAGGPAFWLFPPPFVHGVVLPMLDAIG
jgi:hypothetical protein